MIENATETIRQNINPVNFFLARKFCEKIASWSKKLGIKSHLDFGCGDGKFTSYMANMLPEVSFVGYDTSNELIEGARKSQSSNLMFISSLNGDIYDSASCSFVLHETDAEKAFREVNSVLKKDGILMVLDYNLTKVTQEEFCRKFGCQREQREIQRLGIERAYRIHTKTGIDDFIKLAENSGFQIEVARAFNNGYFAFVGSKQ